MFLFVVPKLDSAVVASGAKGIFAGLNGLRVVSIITQSLALVAFLIIKNPGLKPKPVIALPADPVPV